MCEGVSFSEIAGEAQGGRGHQEGHAEPSPVKTSEDLFLPPRATAGRKQAGGRGSPEDPAKKGAAKAGAPRWGPPPLRGWRPPAQSGFAAEGGKGSDTPQGLRPGPDPGCPEDPAKPRLWMHSGTSLLSAPPLEPTLPATSPHREAWPGAPRAWTRCTLWNKTGGFKCWKVSYQETLRWPTVGEEERRMAVPGGSLTSPQARRATRALAQQLRRKAPERVPGHALLTCSKGLWETS